MSFLEFLDYEYLRILAEMHKIPRSCGWWVNPVPHGRRWTRETPGAGAESLQANLGGSLLLRSVQSTDAGVYICLANSTAGAVRQEVRVRVLPEVSAHIVPVSLRVDSGARAEFLCVTAGTHVSCPAYSILRLSMTAAQSLSLTLIKPDSQESTIRPRIPSQMNAICNNLRHFYISLIPK